MARKFDSSALVSLPRLDAAAAVALGSELLAATEKAKKIPAPVAEARKRLKSAHKALQRVLRDRLTPSADTDRARTADQAEDAAWSALHTWLSGWAKLPTGDEPRRAHTLLTTLFPEGLKFTQLPYKLEWAEADARLQRIAADKLAVVIAELGGTPFVTGLQAAHREYGEALGITAGAPAADNAAAPSLKEPLADVLAALRAYVLQVAAHEDAKPKAGLAKKLLAPLLTWQDRSTHAPAKPATPPTPPDER